MLASGAGAVSLVTTLSTFAVRYEAPEAAGVVGLLEVFALVVLIGLSARWATGPATAAGAVVAGMAVVLWILRFLPPTGVIQVVGACALWFVPVAIAAGLGGFLRRAETRRRRQIRAARSLQRREIARDLHDFVAHDISGMLVQAQAAALVTEPGHALDALRRIETAGLRALASMDRTLDLLRDEDGGTPGSDIAPQPSLDEIERLTETFTAEGPTRVTLTRRVGLDVPREVSSTAYRVVVESLTNVRRHAPAATRVDVAVDTVHGGLRVEVRDDGGSGRQEVPPGNARGGSGLLGLTERVRALGGTFTAEPTAAGWAVLATLPLGTTSRETAS
jgi:signal transduction histidine kinase